MKPFHEALNKIKWDPKEKIEDYTIGYWDRIEGKFLEMPLKEFIESDIPENLARYIKKG